MSAGSDASNIGYGNSFPNSNINNSLVNVSATNNPYSFSTNETGLAASGGHGMLGASNNANGANGCLGGLCNMSSMQQRGGSRTIQRHKKKIYHKYKTLMKRQRQRHSRSRSHTRRYSRSHTRSRPRNRAFSRKMALYKRRMASLSRSLMRSRSRRGGYSQYNNTLNPAPVKMQGGYSQYMGNIPTTNSYSVAGTTLSASNSALANPPPITALSNCTNCVDNYNRYTNSGFQV